MTVIDSFDSLVGSWEPLWTVLTVLHINLLKVLARLLTTKRQKEEKGAERAE